MTQLKLFSNEWGLNEGFKPLAILIAFESKKYKSLRIQKKQQKNLNQKK